MLKKEILIKGEYAAIPHIILTSPYLSSTDKIIYCILLDYLGKHGLAWPSFKTLAMRACCSKRQVFRSIKVLESAKLISVTRDSNKANRYVFNLPTSIIEPIQYDEKPPVSVVTKTIIGNDKEDITTPVSVVTKTIIGNDKEDIRVMTKALPEPRKKTTEVNQGGAMKCPAPKAGQGRGISLESKLIDILNGADPLQILHFCVEHTGIGFGDTSSQEHQARNLIKLLCEIEIEQPDMLPDLTLKDLCAAFTSESPPFGFRNIMGGTGFRLSDKHRYRVIKLLVAKHQAKVKEQRRLKLQELRDLESIPEYMQT